MRLKADIFCGLQIYAKVSLAVYSCSSHYSDAIFYLL